jgi:hypothetical protein
MRKSSRCPTFLRDPSLVRSLRLRFSCLPAAMHIVLFDLSAYCPTSTDRRYGYLGGVGSGF